MDSPQSYYILMADVIKSREWNEDLMLHLKEVVKDINLRKKKKLLSPLTITLGDEFQGIPTSISDAIEIIIATEESILKHGVTFKMRYVLNYGIIDTPINKKIAYQMTGSGLTDARFMLNNLKKNKQDRFHFNVKNETLTKILEDEFIIFQSIVDDWKEKDFETVNALLLHTDYKDAAILLGKHLSLIWRKEKSLKLKEYKAIKSIIQQTLSILS
jgi:hypothetical protein